MTGRRVVVLHEVGNLGAGDIAPLVAYLARPLDTTAFVVVGGGGRLPKALGDALKAAKAVKVAPAAEKTDDVLSQHLADAGIDLRPAASKLVTSHLGEDAGRVPQLVELLAAAAGPGATLDVADVEPYLGDAGSVPDYQLTNAIEAGDIAGALATLRRMVTAPGSGQSRPMHPLQVMGTLHSLLPARRCARRPPRAQPYATRWRRSDGRIKEYPARKALDRPGRCKPTGCARRSTISSPPTSTSRARAPSPRTRCSRCWWPGWPRCRAGRGAGRSGAGRRARAARGVASC